MEGFTNLRTAEVPEIGIMNEEIELILDVVRKMVARYDGWPEKGTMQILWEEDGCEAREMIWCNFAGGKSGYKTLYSGLHQSGSNFMDTDKFTQQTMESVLRERPWRSGLVEHWRNDGVVNALILKTMEGRFFLAANALSGVYSVDYCSVSPRNSQRDSGEQWKMYGLLFGLAEALNAVLEVDAAYRLGLYGDTVLMKSMIDLRKHSDCRVVEVMEFVRNLMEQRAVPAEEKCRQERLAEIKAGLAELRRERMLGLR